MLEPRDNEPVQLADCWAHALRKLFERTENNAAPIAEANPKRVYRIYKEMGLQLLNTSPKRRVKAKLREDRMDAVCSNDVWALDFVHDQLATGRKLRILTVVDTNPRFCPVIDPRFNYRGEEVVATLDRVCRRVGYPKTIRVDNGSEFIFRDMDLWAYQRCVTLDFSHPGKPTDNAFVEAFNVSGAPLPHLQHSA